MMRAHWLRGVAVLGALLLAAGDLGASERFSVAPGHESEGCFHMPGGQSAHPLSPFHRAGFSDWVEARPTPFLPGPAEHLLRLTAAP